MAQTNTLGLEGDDYSFRLGGSYDPEKWSLPAGYTEVADNLNPEVGWQYNDIDLESGAFETNLGLLRVSYSFTQKIFIQGLLQYNDRADIWASNLRFGWLTRANAGLYLVYNEIRDIQGAGTGLAGRSLTLKYPHLFDVLR